MNALASASDLRDRMGDIALERQAAGEQRAHLTRDRLLVLVLLVITGIALGACAALIAPFVPALTWALALAVIASPVHRWIAGRVENRDLAAGLAVVIVAIALVVPVVMLGFHIAQQAAEGLDQLQEMAKSGSWRASLDQHPKIAAIESWIEARFDVGQGAMQIATKVQQYVTTVLKSSFWGGLQLAIALYSLFFFFRDRKHVLGALRGLVPLSNREVDEVFENVRVMVRATIYGNVVTSLLQGTLGGLMFWILGLPAPLLWGVAMFVLSLVPTLGSPLVWVPMAIFLAASGAWGKALILAGWGVFVVGTIDNLLYPLLVGKDIRMHTLAVFLALLGGMFIFGAAGLVLGPVILAITLALIDILRRRTAHGRPAEAPT